MATHSSILAWTVFQGQRSLKGYSPWGHIELDPTDFHTHTHTHTHITLQSHQTQKDSKVCLPQQSVSRSHTHFFSGRGGVRSVLGLPCCTQVFSSCSEWRLLFVAVCGLLIAVASLVAKHRFYSTGSVIVARSLAAPHADVGFSQTRDRTRVSCIGRWILCH